MVGTKFCGYESIDGGYQVHEKMAAICNLDMAKPTFQFPTNIQAISDTLTPHPCKVPIWMLILISSICTFLTLEYTCTFTSYIYEADFTLSVEQLVG